MDELLYTHSYFLTAFSLFKRHQTKRHDITHEDCHSLRQDQRDSRFCHRAIKFSLIYCHDNPLRFTPSPQIRFHFVPHFMQFIPRFMRLTTLRLEAGGAFRNTHHREIPIHVFTL